MPGGSSRSARRPKSTSGRIRALSPDFVGEVNLFEGEVVTPASVRRCASRGSTSRSRCPPAGAAAGRPVALALRPEKLVLSHARPAGFAVRATVGSIDYQGPVSLVHSRRRPGRSLKAHLASAAAGGFAPRRGGMGELDARRCGRDRPDDRDRTARPAGADRCAVSLARAVFSAAAADRAEDQPGP